MYDNIRKKKMSISVRPKPSETPGKVPQRGWREFWEMETKAQSIKCSSQSMETRDKLIPQSIETTCRESSS